MSTNDCGALQPCPTDGGTDLDERDARALAERMGVLPDDGDDLYTVVGCNQNGEYRVDVRERRCTCPDHEYRGVRCKHLRRVLFATGRRPIPAGVARDDVDELLGEHLDDEGPRWAATDGGADVIEAGDEGVILDETEDDDEPTYTYHHEPAHVGGARYVRCETCGAESVPADPDRLLHRDDCPHRAGWRQ